jgi:hypothetical protein
MQKLAVGKSIQFLEPFLQKRHNEPESPKTKFRRCYSDSETIFAKQALN